jgi:hypothetical protein
MLPAVNKTKKLYMKKILLPFALVLMLSCNDAADKTDGEKSESKIEIITDSPAFHGDTDYIRPEPPEDGKDTVEIKINSKDGIKIEGKDGKVELNTDGGGKIKIEKKGKEMDIKIKEN